MARISAGAEETSDVTRPTPSSLAGEYDFSPPTTLSDPADIVDQEIPMSSSAVTSSISSLCAFVTTMVAIVVVNTV